MGSIIRGFTWDIPILGFAYVFFWALFSVLFLLLFFLFLLVYLFLFFVRVLAVLRVFVAVAAVAVAVAVAVLFLLLLLLLLSLSWCFVRSWCRGEAVSGSVGQAKKLHWLKLPVSCGA